MIFYRIFAEFAFNLDLNPVSIPDHSSMIYLCTGIALNWDNRIHSIRPPLITVQRNLSHTEREAIARCKTTCLGAGAGGREQAIVFRVALFNTLAMYTYILCTCSLFWNNFEPYNFFQVIILQRLYGVLIKRCNRWYHERSVVIIKTLE